MFGIAVAAFLDQHHEDKHLVVGCNKDDFEAYARTIDRLNAWPWTILFPRVETGPQGVCATQDRCCETVFRESNCDAAVIWDDDDWKHPSFLSAIDTQFNRSPFVEEFVGGKKEIDPKKDWYITGYRFGHYVNARHLWAVDVGKMLNGRSWGYWGASLAFRKIAWEQHKWSEFTFPGQDPAWCKAFSKNHWAPPVDLDPYKMLSFCHGKNVFQHWRGGGFDLKPWLKDNVPQRSCDEIFRVRNWFIDNNIEPPQCDRAFE